jgi:hypothetical protein
VDEILDAPDVRRRLRNRSGALEVPLSTASLVWGFLFGAIGIGFFVYGKRQEKLVPLICGLVLMVFPYFVSNTVVMVIIGTALMAIPYFYRL